MLDNGHVLVVVLQWNKTLVLDNPLPANWLIKIDMGAESGFYDDYVSPLRNKIMYLELTSATFLLYGCSADFRRSKDLKAFESILEGNSAEFNKPSNLIESQCKRQHNIG